MEINQYDIVLVNLDPTVGSEIKKTRPCVVVSPDEMNKYLNTVVVAPMTGQSKSYPTRVEVKRNTEKSWVVIDQIRTIDKHRVIKLLDRLEPNEIMKVKTVIRETYVD
jgi:mRNA interferase MazF